MKRAIMILVIALVAVTGAYGAANETVPHQDPPQYLYIAQLNSWCTETTYLDGEKEQVIYICKPVETKGK